MLGIQALCHCLRGHVGDHKALSPQPWLPELPREKLDTLYRQQRLLDAW